jgi:hypothetical protein
MAVLGFKTSMPSVLEGLEADVFVERLHRFDIPNVCAVRDLECVLSSCASRAICRLGANVQLTSMRT